MDDLQVEHARVETSGGSARIHAADHLCGPPGILQGGLATALLARAVAATVGGTPIRVRARLHRPTPTGSSVGVVVSREPADHTGAGRTDEAATGPATTWSCRVVADPAASGLDEERVLVSGHVATEGRVDDVGEHDDLVSIAGREPLPRPQAVPAAPDCVVCGARNPHGLHLFPGWYPDGAVVEAWEADDRVAGPGGMFVRPEVIAAVLDCPTVWASRDACRAAGFGGAMLGGFDVTWYSRLPVGEAVRIAAVLDRADGKKLSARAGIVGRDGLLYAVATALQVGVEAMPGADPDLDPFGDDLDDD